MHTETIYSLRMYTRVASEDRTLRGRLAVLWALIAMKGTLIPKRSLINPCFRVDWEP